MDFVKEVLVVIILILAAYIISPISGLITAAGFVFLFLVFHRNIDYTNFKNEELNDEDTFDTSKIDSNPNQQDESISKGDLFEKYVVDRFDPEYFSIVEWTSDISRKHSRTVESDMNPDLVVRFKPSDEIFAVECKYRSGLFNGKLEWSNDTQRARYLQFALERNIPVFVVIGLGGSPSFPENMFCIPLVKAKYSSLYPSVFEKYYHNPSKNFIWNESVLR